MNKPRDEKERCGGTPLPSPLWRLGGYGFQAFLKLPVVRRAILALARRQMPDMWRYISIEPWTACNLRCKVCHYPQMTRKKAHAHGTL
jgi:sulfatase maturation enzyme AslB (radical SAM superfamily)